MEIWKDVVGYEGIYEVSNRGNVRTHINKRTYTKRHGVRTWEQRVLKEKNPKGRDARVDLWKDGKPKSFLVHQLVGKAFIPSVPGKHCINHIDGNPKNNNVENLEWCNHLENNRHAFKNGLMTTNKKVYLKNKENGEVKEFISRSEASRFLGRNNGYISVFLKRDKYEVISKSGNKYEIVKHNEV